MSTTGQAERFDFGQNWRSYLTVLNPERERLARESVQRLCDPTHKTFLDIGCGSGLFSLAALQLGAVKITSVDIDADSVAATMELYRRAGRPGYWGIRQASILNANLTPADIVYSWGVLHHTGDMWTALARAADLVNHGGVFVVSLYNDQGVTSRAWRIVKRTYNRLPRALRPAYAVLAIAPHTLLQAARSVPKTPSGLRQWRRDRRAPRARGMSRWHDIVDWVGGYPFEVARPEQVVAFMRERGFRLVTMTACGNGHGCNEYVFAR